MRSRSVVSLLLFLLALVGVLFWIGHRKNRPGPSAATNTPLVTPSTQKVHPTPTLNVSDHSQSTIRVNLRLNSQEGSEVSNVAIRCPQGEFIWISTNAAGEATANLPQSRQAQVFEIFAGHRNELENRLYWLKDTRQVGPQEYGPLEWVLTYNRLSRVNIHVRDQMGHPVPSLPITIPVGFRPGPRDSLYKLFCRLTGPGPIVLKLLTGADGDCFLDYVHPDYHLEFNAGDGASRLRPITTDLQDDPSHSVYSAVTYGQYTMTLKRAERPEFVITVLDPTGKPLAGAQVRTWVAIQDPVESVYGTTCQGSLSDKDGQVRLRLDAFEFPLATETRRFWAISWHREHGLTFSSGTISRNSPSTTLTHSSVNAGNPDGTTISVRFLESRTLAPLAQLSASLYSDAFGNTPLFTTISDADGRIRIPGVYARPDTWPQFFDPVFRYSISLDSNALIDGELSTAAVAAGVPVDMRVRIERPAK